MSEPFLYEIPEEKDCVSNRLFAKRTENTQRGFWV